MEIQIWIIIAVAAMVAGYVIATIVSRNMAKSRARLIIDEAASGIVFEGKNSIKAIKDICDNHNINSDIVNFVYDVIIKKISPIKSFNKLWENIE